MKNANKKFVSVAIAGLCLNLIAISPALADHTFAPGSACNVERGGSSAVLDRQQGSIRTSERMGTVVTCPVIKTTPYLGTQGGQLITATAYYTHTGSNVPITCALRWTHFAEGGARSTDSRAVASDSRDRGKVRVSARAIPFESWTVLRCQLPYGVTLGAYRVEITG